MKVAMTLTLTPQFDRYFCAAQDESGVAPTESQWDHFLHARTVHSSKARAQVMIWQPHLHGDPRLIPALWQFIRRHTFTKANYQTLQLNPSQAWWMIVPVEPEFESHPHWKTHIISRQQMIDYMLGAPIEWGSAFQIDTLLTLNVEFGRVTTVAGQHGFYTTCVNQVVLAAKEFNLIFGEYFNHIPVIPYMMLQLWSKPSIVRTRLDGRLIQRRGPFTWYNRDSYDWTNGQAVGIGQRTQQVRWMKDGTVGNLLTREEYDNSFEFGAYEKIAKLPRWNMEEVLW